MLFSNDKQLCSKAMVNDVKAADRKVSIHTCTQTQTHTHTHTHTHTTGVQQLNPRCCIAFPLRRYRQSS